jgi:hypothetical protein
MKKKAMKTSQTSSATSAVTRKLEPVKDCDQGFDPRVAQGARVTIRRGSGSRFQ